MFDNVCKFLAENFSQDYASCLLDRPVTLTKLSPTELSLEPIRAEPIPNSTVKRSCGDDTLGGASWDNTSMPRLFFQQNKQPFSLKWGELCFFYARFHGLRDVNLSYWAIGCWKLSP